MFKHDPVFSSFVEQGFACYLPDDMEFVVLANSPEAADSLGLGGIVVRTHEKHIVLKPVGG